MKDIQWLFAMNKISIPKLPLIHLHTFAIYLSKKIIKFILSISLDTKSIEESFSESFRGPPSVGLNSLEEKTTDAPLLEMGKYNIGELTSNIMTQPPSPLNVKSLKKLRNQTWQKKGLIELSKIKYKRLFYWPNKTHLLLFENPSWWENLIHHLIDFPHFFEGLYCFFFKVYWWADNKSTW